MFYNGCCMYVYAYIFYEFLFSMFQNIISSGVMRNSTKLQLNDGNVFLNLIASPVYSVLFLIVCNAFYLLNLTRISHNILFLFIILQSYFYNVFDIITVVSNVFNSKALIITLQNGLLNVHPYIIYILYGYILIYIIYSTINSTISSSVLLMHELKYILTLLVLFSIILGA